MYAVWWGYVTAGHVPFAAKITGLDPVYKFKREFAKGTWDNTYAKGNRRYGKRVYFHLEPDTIYDVREIGQGKQRYRAFLLTDNEGNYSEITESEVIEWLTTNAC